jgi:phosphoribosylformimino-5-aminoimidazole carboxamide ribotide isomerase
VPVRVQAGGGVRDVEAAGVLLGAGAARVVVGTAAVAQPQLVADLAAMHPGQVAVGIDARGRDVAVQGWTERTGIDVAELAARFAASGASAVIVTEIGRDGTMEGPALDQLLAVLAASPLPVIASGGVGGLEDLAALAGLRAGGRGLAGVIVGRALYEGRFTLRAALTAVGGGG